MKTGRGKGIEIMAQYLNSVMQKGQLRSANPKVAAVHYRALIEAEVDEAGLLNVLQPMSDGDIRDYVARAVDVFMRAYLTRDAMSSRRNSWPTAESAHLSVF